MDTMDLKIRGKAITLKILAEKFQTPGTNEDVYLSLEIDEEKAFISCGHCFQIKVTFYVVMGFTLTESQDLNVHYIVVKPGNEYSEQTGDFSQLLTFNQNYRKKGIYTDFKTDIDENKILLRLSTYSFENHSKVSSENLPEVSSENLPDDFSGNLTEDKEKRSSTRIKLKNVSVENIKEVRAPTAAVSGIIFYFVFN